MATKKIKDQPYCVRFLRDTLTFQWKWCICKRDSWAPIASGFENRAEADAACARYNAGENQWEK